MIKCLWMGFRNDWSIQCGGKEKLTSNVTENLKYTWILK